MSQSNYYEVLEVLPTASQEEIKRSYKRLALRFHPDKHGGKKEASMKFHEISEAYTVLSDARKKNIYDTYGYQGLKIDEEQSENQSGINIFLQKGFCGTDKSAFDILKDILTEKNEDDSFFKQYETINISDSFKSDIDSFMTQSFAFNDEEDTFLSGYKPTFMDTTFLDSFTLFSMEMPTTEKLTRSSSSSSAFIFEAEVVFPASTSATYSGVQRNLNQKNSSKAQSSGKKSKTQGKFQNFEDVFIESPAKGLKRSNPFIDTQPKSAKQEMKGMMDQQAEGFTSKKIKV